LPAKIHGDISAAQETVKQAIAGDPLSVENWLIQADLFAEQGRHQSALESLEKALSLLEMKMQVIKLILPQVQIHCSVVIEKLLRQKFTTGLHK
jgi:lipopolysaccharide biosynthesis regulator YciM